MPVLFSGWGEKSLKVNKRLSHYLRQYSMSKVEYKMWNSLKQWTTGMNYFFLAFHHFILYALIYRYVHTYIILAFACLSILYLSTTKFR